MVIVAELQSSHGQRLCHVQPLRIFLIRHGQVETGTLIGHLLTLDVDRHVYIIIDFLIVLMPLADGDARSSSHRRYSTVHDVERSANIFGVLIASVVSFVMLLHFKISCSSWTASLG